MLPHSLFDQNQYDTEFAADTELHRATKQCTSCPDKLASPFLYVQKWQQASTEMAFSITVDSFDESFLKKCTLRQRLASWVLFPSTS